MKVICPMCGSENIVPFFANDKIWICLECGYSGPIQSISGHLEFFWEDYKKHTSKSISVSKSKK
ncbi:MAG: hypothetical protein QW038_01275 [Nanopusillaceae archaeon]